MILAHLLSDSEDEIICDLAETYHVLNYQELPPDLVATLVIGLPDSSRIKRKLTKKKTTMEAELLALIVDLMATYMWSRSGRKGTKPPSIYKILTKEDKEKDELEAFDSIEEYEAWRKSKEEMWRCQNL